VPEPVDEIPVSETVELLAQTVAFAPALTVPGSVTRTAVVTVCPGHPFTVANSE
jgi:hypothetical protein